MDRSNNVVPIALSSYVEQAALEWERLYVFGAAAEYVGCTPLVPVAGSYYSNPRRDHAEILVNSGGVIRLLSNVCLHRSMLIACGAGRCEQLVCPMHAWAYDLDGAVRRTPRYTEHIDLRLPNKNTQNWNGIVFAGQRDVATDLAPLCERPELDISRYVLGQQEQQEQPVNWKIPVEVLLENYHVPVIHPGLTRFVDPSSWTGSDGYDSDWLAYQEMRPHPQFDTNPKSAVFERWQRAILTVSRGERLAFGALIALYFPATFLEWYPFTFVVTTYTPRCPGVSLMTRDFFYDPVALEIVPAFAELAKAAWDENQKQDDVAHEALQRGREVRYREFGDGPSGYHVYQSPTEDSVRAFHEHLSRLIGTSRSNGGGLCSR